MAQFEIIDVTDWERSEEVASGTRPKDWLYRPADRRRGLFKRHLYGLGELWAEKLASEFGKILGINVPDVELARSGDVLGVLVYSFLASDESHNEGLTLIRLIDENFNERTTYDIELVRRILTEIGISFYEFIKIIVFDAFIGNQDRHIENWGIMIEHSGAIKLAPAYDNSSSLGWSQTERNALMCLQNESMMMAFIARGTSMITCLGRPKITHMHLIDYLIKNYPEETTKELHRYTDISHYQIESLVKMIPSEFMSDIAKDFTIKITQIRKDVLIAKVN